MYEFHPPVKKHFCVGCYKLHGGTKPGNCNRQKLPTISQGSAATCLRRGGTFNDNFITAQSPSERILTRAQQLLGWATVSPQQTWAKKWELLSPFLWGGDGSPSNTMSPRSVSVLSGILNLDPANCLATIHQRYRQKGQTTVR